MRIIDDFHPWAILIYFMAVIIPVMFLMNLIIIAAAFFSGLILLWLARKKIPLSTIALSVAVLAVFVIVNGFTVHEGSTELFFINGRAVTFESLRYGFVTGLMAASAIIWFELFSLVMSGEKILYIFRYMKKTGLIISMIMKLVSEYVTRYTEVKMASHREDSIKNSLGNMSAVFTWALENSMETADSMENRGFDMKKFRSHKRYHLKRKDLVLAVFTIAAALGLFVPKIREMAGIIITVIPEIYIIKESLKWKWFDSRKQLMDIPKAYR